MKWWTCPKRKYSGASRPRPWPIANAYIPGYGRNELMASHMSNHIVVGYGDILEELVALCKHLGIKTRVGGDAAKALKQK